MGLVWVLMGAGIWQRVVWIRGVNLYQNTGADTIPWWPHTHTPSEASAMGPVGGNIGADLVGDRLVGLQSARLRGLSLPGVA